MKKQILVNQIKTPDGTIIQSRHRHDYVTHTDKNGLEYMCDGGMDYLRRNIHKDAPHKEMSVYTTDPHEEIRKYVERGGRGVNGDEPLKHVILKDIGNHWLGNIIKWEEEHRPDNAYLPIYRAEVKFRE